MRSYPIFLAAIALTLSACGSEPGLPEDIVGRAATCAVVAAADARSTIKSLDTPLAFDRQSQIIHYALLAGASDPGFSRENANGVVKRMQTLQERITGDEWVPLIEPCRTAFPEANLSRAVTLPVAPAEAHSTCYALGSFMSRALSAYEDTYNEHLMQYSGLLRKLKPAANPASTESGFKPDADQERAERGAALTAAAKLGPPAKVMDACIARFPPDKEVKMAG